MQEEYLQEQAIETYQKNMFYFESHDTILYNKMLSFDLAIEQNHYQNKYDLILKDCYFDVLELSTNNYLYNSSSNDYATLAAQSINFQKDSNAYQTFRKMQINKDGLAKYEAVGILENTLSGLAPILTYIDEYSNDTTDLKKIEKFIFFGVGLGQHIVAIDAILKAQMYFIIEDDLELFKLSLFVTPYYKLAEHSQLIFSVFEDKQEFSNTASKFLENKFYYNHYIKYFQMLNHSDEKLEEFHIKIASQSHNLFFYNIILEQYLRPLEYIKEEFNFLNILKPYVDSSLQNKPILYLAAGPSLLNNIEWIQTHQDKFLIVALSATLSILEEHNIMPSIVTHLDGFDDATEHFTKLDSLEFLRDTILLMSARTPHKIITLLNKGNIFLFENGTSYKKDLGNLSAPCVGSTTYLLLLALGVENLYLLGLDLALDNETGATHSQGHFQGKKLDTTQQHKDIITFKDHVVEVQGNLREKVLTLPDWRLSIESINQTSLGFKKQTQSVYNLSDGALFSNTKVLEINSLNLLSFDTFDKKDTFEELHTLFVQNSSHSLQKSELALLKQREKHAKKIKNFIQSQERKTFATEDDFLKSLILLAKNMSANSSAGAYDISLIYQEYFRMIYSFIFDFFNSDSLKNRSQHANQINKLLVIQLSKIIEIYSEGLKVIK